MLSKNLAETRRQLTEKILNFLGNTENSYGILVFDGPNLSFSNEVYSEQLEIYYGKTADTIIEKISKEINGSFEITLVSSDNTIYNSILPTKGLVCQIKATEFWQKIEKIPKSFQSQKYREPRLADRINSNTQQELDKLRKS